MPEIYFEKMESASLTYSGGELKIKETSTDSGYGIRTIEDGRIGFSYCQNEGQIKETIEKAKLIGRFSPRSNFSFAPKSSYPGLDIFDSSLDPNDFDFLKGILAEAREAAEKFGGKSRINATAEKCFCSLENDEGFHGEYKKTEFSIYIECMNADGLGIEYYSSNRKPDSVTDLALRAAGTARDMQGAKKPESGNYTVVMELEALDSLIETLLPSFSGDWKRRGITKLQEGFRFSEMFTMYEDGRSAGADSRPFDDEGIPSEKRAMVEKGELKSFLYDRETAALEGVELQGTCTRNSYDDRPSIGSSNIVVSPGDCRDFSELGKHIELHYAHGSHTANLTTGDIGLEVSCAFLADGDKRMPLKGFMIVGNIFDMFKSIEAIESRQRISDWLVSPRIAFSSLKVVS
ncbi:TldD/PmbA family protein [Candidatus Micrarchaeota archaeon]|nr:TldD/PmbA family protein [Candidatus Micrarchaeota archaeon]